MLSTRLLVALVPVTLALPLAGQPAPAGTFHCLRRGLSAAAFEDGQVSMSSGVRPLDFIIDQQSVQLRNTFLVLPEVYYLLGPFTLNAYASPEKTEPFAAGSVFLGRDLLASELVADV